jgi:hypothetical protein
MSNPHESDFVPSNLPVYFRTSVKGSTNFAVQQDGKAEEGIKDEKVSRVKNDVCEIASLYDKCSECTGYWSVRRGPGGG